MHVNLMLSKKYHEKIQNLGQVYNLSVFLLQKAVTIRTSRSAEYTSKQKCGSWV